MACFDKGWAFSPHAHMVTPAPLPNFSRVNHLPTQHTKAPTVSIPCNFLFASSNPNWGSDSRTLCREEKIKMKQKTQSKHSSPNQHGEASPIWAVLLLAISTQQAAQLGAEPTADMNRTLQWSIIVQTCSEHCSQLPLCLAASATPPPHTGACISKGQL